MFFASLLFIHSRLCFACQALKFMLLECTNSVNFTISTGDNPAIPIYFLPLSFVVLFSIHMYDVYMVIPLFLRMGNSLVLHSHYVPMIKGGVNNIFFGSPLLLRGSATPPVSPWNFQLQHPIFYFDLSQVYVRLLKCTNSVNLTISTVDSPAVSISFLPLSFSRALV